MTKVENIYLFDSSRLNPNFENGLKALPDKRKKAPRVVPKGLPKHMRGRFHDGRFESCLIPHNSENERPPIHVKTEPKRFTRLTVLKGNRDTGEIIEELGYYETNEMTQARGRKIKAVNKFCDYFEPLFKVKEVSLMFLTFTRLNHAKIDFSGMIDDIKYHITTILGIRIRGYIWVLEVSERMHCHYHLCIAIDRCNYKKMPDELKFEGLWGQRTQVTFVRKTIRGYLMKYLAKCHFSILGFRSYGISRKLI